MKKVFNSFLLLTVLFGSNPTIEKEVAPTFYLPTLEGKNFFLSKSLKEGNPIVFSFFATWCAPCRKEMPKLDSLAQVFKDIKFYLINVSGLTGKDKEDTDKVKKMLISLDVSLPVLMDNYAITAKKYGALTLPTTVVINPEGIIIYKHTGYEAGDEKKLSTVLEQFPQSKKPELPTKE